MILDDLNDQEKADVAKRVCPWSGGALLPREYDDGPVNRDRPNVYSCGVCDCFGFGLKEVGHVGPE